MNGRPARVALYADSFPNLSETFVAALVRGLLERGNDVHVICRRSDPEMWARFPELDRPAIRRRVHVVATRERFLHRMLSVVVDLLVGAVLHPVVFLRWVRVMARRSPRERIRTAPFGALAVRLAPDIVHFQFGSQAKGRLHVKEDVGCRVIVSFRGLDANYVGLDDRSYYDEVWSAADAVHVLGTDLDRRTADRGRPPTMPTVIIAPAVDVGRFQPAPSRGDGASDDGLHLLSIGRLHWKKGHEWSVVALKGLRDRGIPATLRVLGDGAQREAVENVARALGVADHLDLRGAVGHADVVGHLRWADVVVHAAVSEGFGNAVLEAQSCAIPVVCTDADGLAENVEHGVTGFVVPRRDAHALCDSIASLAGLGVDGRREMGDAGRRRVVEHFGTEHQLQRFEQLYASVLDERPSPRDDRRPPSGSRRPQVARVLAQLLPRRASGEDQGRR